MFGLDIVLVLTKSCEFTFTTDRVISFVLRNFLQEVCSFLAGVPVSFELVGRAWNFVLVSFDSLSLEGIGDTKVLKSSIR